MPSSIKIAAIRGAGLSFPLACLLYLFFGDLSAFALLPLGALVGLGLGALTAKNPGMWRKLHRLLAPARSIAKPPSWLARSLYHPNLLARLVSLTLFSAGLLLITWCIGYYLLPDGAFRAGSAAHMNRAALEAPSASVLEEWSKIFRANLLPALTILAGSLLLRINGFSFGYLVAMVNIAGYGLYLGTNSFAISMPARMAPSLAVLERSGPYEMFALLLLAAAAYPWSFFEIKQLFITNPERVQPRPSIGWREAAAALAGLLFLAAANWVEASMVMAAAL